MAESKAWPYSSIPKQILSPLGEGRVKGLGEVENSDMMRSINDISCEFQYFCRNSA